MNNILVTGVLVSRSGKGVAARTVDLLLKACGVRIIPIKIEHSNLSDPHLNTDAGTMPPFEHGGDVDLDRGNCERFLIKSARDNYITAGKIYLHVIAKEREGDYLGKTTVQGWRSLVGGNTHLGSRKSFFSVKDSNSAKLYDAKNFVDERHRHRYEVWICNDIFVYPPVNLIKQMESHTQFLYVNPHMVERQEKAGLSLAAKDEIGKSIEVCFKLLSLE